MATPVPGPPVKRLWLLRHAKSKWKGSAELRDHDRPLARRGRDDAHRLAKLLHKHGVTFDHVLCSSARRARQTWEQLEPRLHIKAELQRALYLPTREALLEQIARLPNQHRDVLIVGHNPSLEALALSLVKQGDTKLHARLSEKFPTCGLCVLEWQGEAFADVQTAEVRLRYFARPHSARSAQADGQPRKAQPLELSEKPRMRDTAWLVFSDALAQVRENLAGARASDDPEFVHQLRVGVRRLRTALRVFGKALDKQHSKHLRAELKWLFRELGALREYDVFLTEHVLPLSAQHDLGDLQRTCTRERSRRLSLVQKALASARFASLLCALLDFETRITSSTEGDPKLVPFARKALERGLRRVHKRKAAIEAHDAHALHELRKVVKRLRYLCEFVQAVFPRRATHHFRKRLEGLQDVLGELNDVAVSERILARSLPRNASKTVKQRLREPVHAHLSAIEAKARADFEQAWTKFAEAKPFWR